MSRPDLQNAPQPDLTQALRQTDDEEFAVEAACATGDQLRFGEIQRLDEALREALVSAVRDQQSWNDLRFEAAIALCEARDPRGSALIETLEQRDRRFDACKALSRLGLDEVKAALLKLSRRFFLAWPDRLVASGACAVLGERDGAAFFERTLVSRWFGSRRAMALHLLGELRHPEAFPILTTLIDNRDDPARTVAIRALGHLGDRRAVAKLESLLPAENSDVADDVRYALDLLT